MILAGGMGAAEVVENTEKILFLSTITGFGGMGIVCIELSLIVPFSSSDVSPNPHGGGRWGVVLFHGASVYITQHVWEG